MSSSVPASTALIESASNSIHGGTFYSVAGDMKVHVNHIQNSLDRRAKICEVIEWLGAVNFRTIQSDTFKKHAAGTGIWLLEHLKFMEWIQGIGKVTWITGMPGSGKTVLTSLVVNHLQRKVALSTKVLVLVAYLRHDSNLTARDIFAALTSQIADDETTDASVQDYLIHFYETHKLQRTTPSTVEFVELWTNVFPSYQHVLISIDALDESLDEVKEELLDGISQTTAGLFITSRPSAELFKSMLDEVHSISLQESLTGSGDIETYVRLKLKTIPRLKWIIGVKKETLDEVCEQLVRKSAGMFLLCALQIDALRRATNMFEFWNTLQSFPTELAEMHQVTWARIRALPPKDFDLARRTILWITHKQEYKPPYTSISYLETDLNASAICEALGVCNQTRSFQPTAIPQVELLEAVCCGLVTTDTVTNPLLGQEERVLRLAHYTTYDFFNREDVTAQLSPTPHGELALTCAIHLLQQGRFTIPRNTPFARYAMDYWGIHARLHVNQLHDLPQPVVDVMRAGRLIPIQVELPVSLRRHDPLPPQECDFVTLAHYAVRFGLHQLKDYILSHRNDHSANGLLPIHFVEYLGDADISLLMALFEGGVDVNAPTQHEHLTPLMIAAAQGNDVVVQALASHPDIDMALRDCEGRTALHMIGNHDHLALRFYDRTSRAVKFKALAPLLFPRSDLNARDSKGRTPFILWLKGYFHPPPLEDLRVWLNNSGLDVNAQDDDGKSPLSILLSLSHHAARSLAPLEALLAHPKLDVNLQNKRGRTALHCDFDDLKYGYPPDPGDLGILRRYLSHPDVDVSIRDARGRTVLDQAMERRKNDGWEGSNVVWDRPWKYAEDMIRAHPTVCL